MNRLAERLLIATASMGGYALLVHRPWLHMGSTRMERHAPLPGDEFIVRARVEGTRATSIDVPPDQVWPWLDQMGHGRAGWYGYDLWDNAGTPSAKRLLPDVKPLAVGDVIADAMGPFGFRVVRLDPGKAVVFRATIHPITGKRVDVQRQPDTPFIDFTWTFVLRENDAGGTRLLVRVRYNHSLHPWVALAVDGYEAVDALFTRKMLRGIRSRAQGTAPAPAPHQWGDFRDRPSATDRGAAAPVPVP